MTHDTQPIADFFAEQQKKLQDILYELNPYDEYDYFDECGFDDTFDNQ